MGVADKNENYYKHTQGFKEKHKYNKKNQMEF